MKKIIYLVMAVCFSMEAMAQNFESSGDYAQLDCLIYDPVTNGRMYAATFGNHIVVSQDNGSVWDVLYSHPRRETIKDLRMLPGNAALSFRTSHEVHILELATGSLSASIPIPQNDVPGATQSNLLSYSLYDAQGTTMAIITHFSIGQSYNTLAYYTNDSGEHWNEIYYSADHENYNATNIAISPGDPAKIFMTRLGAALDAGLWISLNQGQQWTTTLDNYTLGIIAFNPSNPDDIMTGSRLSSSAYPESLFRSSDGGVSWNEIPVNWSQGVLNDIKDIVFNPADTDQITVLEENEILHTTDSGLNWEKIVYPVEGGTEYFAGTSAAYNPFASGKVAITSAFYPRFFEQATGSLSPITAPFLSASSVSVSNAPYNLYYGAKGGRHRRDLTTNVVSAYDTAAPTVAFPLYNYIFADPVVAGRLMVVAAGELGASLKISTDYGVTAATISDVFANDMQAIAVDPNNTNLIYASLRLGEAGNLYKIDLTDPANAQITEVVTPQVSENGNGVVGGIIIDPADSGTLYISKRHKVFKSVDGGQNWEQITNGLEAITDLDLIWQLTANPLDANQLTVASNMGIFTSMDKGLHWSSILEGVNIKKVKHSPIHNGVLIGASLSGQFTTTSIHYTADNGQTWQTLADSEMYFTQSQGIDFLFEGNDITAYIATPDLGVISYRIQDVTLGTDQPQQDAQGGIYPNPASGVVNIYTGSNTAPASVSVYSLSGQLVLQAKAAQFDASALSNGIYVVKVETDNGTHFVKKLVKQ